MSETLQRVWLQGFIAGLEHYAWWKDGTQYVGSCGTTLAEAVDRANKEYAVMPDTVEDQADAD